MTSPFLAALGQVPILGPLVANPINAYNEAETINNFEAKVQELKTQGVAPVQALTQALQEPGVFENLPRSYITNHVALAKLAQPVPEQMAQGPNG